MQVSASLNNLRIAPRKVGLVANSIRGLSAADALVQLEVTVKRTSPQMKKLLESAIANAENNFGLDRNNLYISEVRLGAGPTMKRWMPRAFGRASQILKRTSKVMIIVAERVEGKGRKSKEQLEKEREKRMEVKKKEAEAQRQREEKESKEGKKPVSAKKTEFEGENRDTGKKSWGNRIFRRKSM